MKTQIFRHLAFIHLALGLSVVAADVVAAQDWQEQRLFSPAGAQLSSEQHGRIVIYDGLDERLVDRALDTQFARVEHMMFVGVRHRGPEGGEWADDDCD